MSDLRDTITNAAKSAAKTSGDLLKSAKINMNLSAAESSLKNLYFEIGKKVHEVYQNGISLGEWFDEKYSEIRETENKIAEMKEQLHELKGVRKCLRCEKISDKTSEFCPKCGAAFQEIVPISNGERPEPPEPYEIKPLPPPPEPYSPPEPKTKICRVCNTQNDLVTKFCFSCGRILD